ncbi:MAG: nucleoside triphosphate pyrophosphohydrolase [Pseudomonadota bacterium]
MPTDTPTISTLLDIMARLRAPDGGCPWDIEQTFRTIAPYTIEEAYEVADAIEQGDLAQLKDELGDLLFQVVFHAQMASEQGAFNFDEVVAAIVDKMIRRHPHVFGDAIARSAEEQTNAWETQKAEERQAKSDAASILDDVPVALPAATRAVKLQKRAAHVGFDWPHTNDVLAKLEEEAGELVEAANTKDPDAVEDEFGDLLFVMANLARHLKVEPEAALRRANAKFERRFRHIEQQARDNNRDMTDHTLDELESYWRTAKQAERST